MARIPLAINGAPVTLIRSRRRRRTFSVCVKHPGHILVRAPHRVPEHDVASFIRKREAWIQNRLRRCQEALDFQSKLRQEETWPFLGQPTARPTAPNAKKWYCRQAAAYLKQRTEILATKMGLEAPSIKINSARQRWGACSAQNVLHFPWRLMMLPPEIIDYIVVHELAHVREKNHGPGFWRFALAALPSLMSGRRWLRDHQHLYAGLFCE